MDGLNFSSYLFQVLIGLKVFSIPDQPSSRLPRSHFVPLHRPLRRPSPFIFLARASPSFCHQVDMELLILVIIPAKQTLHLHRQRCALLSRSTIFFALFGLQAWSIWSATSAKHLHPTVLIHGGCRCRCFAKRS